MGPDLWRCLAMLSGNMEEYDRLNGLLVSKQLKGSHGTKDSGVKVLEEIDGAGRHVKMKNDMRQESVRMKGKLRGKTETSAGLNKDPDKVRFFFLRHFRKKLLVFEH